MLECLCLALNSETIIDGDDYSANCKGCKSVKGKRIAEIDQSQWEKMLIQTIEVEKKISRYPPTDELRTIRWYTPHEELPNRFEKFNHRWC